MSDRANEDHECWPSQKRLEQDTCLDRKTIIKAIKSLEQKQIIIRKEEKKGARNRGNIYKFISVKGREYRQNNEPKVEKLNSPTFGTIEGKNGTIEEFNSPKCGTFNSPVFGTLNLSIESPIKEKEKINKKESPESFFGYQETYYPPPSAPPSPLTKSEMGFNDLLERNPFGLSAQMIQDWISVRKKKKSAITLTAWNLLLKELTKIKNMGKDPNEAFEVAIANSWLTIKADWILDKKVTPQKTEYSIKTQSKSPLDYSDMSWADDLGRF